MTAPHPPPTYPQYQGLVAEALRTTSSFVDPRNLYPAAKVADRRGGDWCTAVLGKSADYRRWTAVDHQLVILADAADINPPLPDWVRQRRRAAEEHQRLLAERRQKQRQRDNAAWVAALADTTVDLDVHLGSRPRAWAGGEIGHAVPRADVHSGTRKVRVHPAGRPLCESPTRARPLAIAGAPAPGGTPVTCARCLSWAPRVRSIHPDRDDELDQLLRRTDQAIQADLAATLNTPPGLAQILQAAKHPPNRPTP